MTLRLITATLILSITAWTAIPAAAAVQTITASHTYVMGDNDSKNDARRMCFLEAKRKVLEKAGTLIESSTEVQNFHLTKDQITSYTAAVLSVETVKEDFGSSNGQNTVTMTVKAEVDTADVQKRLAAIVADKGLQEKITTQQQQIKQLEEQMRALNMKLGAASTNSSAELRKERNVILGNINELENKKLVATKTIDDLSEKVVKYIARNMTMKEVIDILGSPRGKGYLYGEDDGSLNYGEYWINFEGGVVKCITREQDYMCHQTARDERFKNLR